MSCFLCEMRTHTDELVRIKEAERKELGICWLDGAINNPGQSGTTTIRIDCDISEDHRREMLDLLKRIETVR